ncbi:glycosyltransferase family 4 protein [Flexivirga endophytica]
MYRVELGPRLWARVSARTEIRTIEGLPQPLCSAPKKDRGRVIFLGSFEERKGLQDLLRAWPAVAAQAGTELVIVGKGSRAQEAFVRTWAEHRRGVTVRFDPPRSDIRAELEAASVLVLASRRTATWREQIGLPILEGLSYGCTIVSSDETGIAQWLSAHGHRVVGSRYSPSELALAIVSAVTNPLPPMDVLESLPKADQRTAADSWLLRS